MTADVDRRQSRELLHIRSHLLRTHRAIDPDGQQVEMRDRIPKGLNRLARERAPRLVGNRHRC